MAQGVRWIPANQLVFYKEFDEFKGVSSVEPYCPFYGEMELPLTAERVFDSSVDFMNFGLSLWPEPDACKVIYTDLWRYTPQELLELLTRNLIDDLPDTYD